VGEEVETDNSNMKTHKEQINTNKNNIHGHYFTTSENFYVKNAEFSRILVT